MNISRADGSVLIAYANSRADTNDILEELLEAYIKHQLNSNPDITEAHLAAFLTEVDKHLPGKTILPKNKKPGEYTRSDLVEAYSRLALASYIYQEAHLPLSPGGHQLLQNIGKILDTAHVFKTIGDAWHTYANSPEGKAHLANGGKQLADILRESGFKVGSLVAQAKATAQQQIETIEAANWQPDIEAELDALLEGAEAEQQLAEINEQQAKEPITIPADQSITGQEITIDPQREEPIVNSQSSIVNSLLSLIQQGKAKTQDFARFFRDNPAITDAEATEQGIRPLTQKGTPTAAYTQGRLIAANLTPQQFEDYLNGKLKGKALKQALSKPGTSVPTTSTFSIKAVNASLFSDVKAAKAELKKVQGQTFTNGEVHAIVSGQTIGKTHAAQMSIRNLTALGYSEDEARKIHYSACTKIHEIFESAPYGFFEPNYDQSNKKGRDGAWHYFGVVNIAGYGEFDVNVSAIKTTKESDDNPLFTLELTIENPSGVSGDTLSQRGRALRSEGSSGSRLSAYRSFVEKEMAAIKKKSQNDGTFMLAPNGKPSKLTEKQWLTVRTQAFKNWFGDWENDPANASKVVDENGEPLVVYHGTVHGGFRVFDVDGRGKTEGTGAFFTSDKRVAEGYSANSHMSGVKPEVYACFLNIREPYEVDFEGNSWNRVPDRASGYFVHYDNGESEWFSNRADADFAVSDYEGKAEIEEDWEESPTLDDLAREVWEEEPDKDGIIAKNVVDSAVRANKSYPATDFIVVSPNQIKSATDNRGTFDGSSPDITFSIKPATADTLDRFTVDPLGERIIHHIRTEARRYSRLLGDKTPYEQAVNAAQSAASIIGAVDKYLHTPGKPVPARYRRQLQKLRSIAEKYAQIIASGTPRSFKKISPQEKQELENAIAELEAQELDTATTESDQLLTDSDRLTKREAAARAREHHRAIVRSAAKGRVYQTLSSMLEVTADALDSYLKHQLLQKLDRLTATVKIKRSPSKRLQGKMTAPAYRELERAINNMALSP